MISLAHLGPTGTYAETAALLYSRWLEKNKQETAQLHPYTSIAQTLHAVTRQETELAIVPVENSTEGSVTVTLDTLWQLYDLKIQQELILPIHHLLFSRAASLNELKTVYSHPQALAQCQRWLDEYVSNAFLIPTNSTAEALQHPDKDPTVAAIASPRAAELYDIPILAEDINDYPDNCTRFWILGLNSPSGETRLSLAFTVPHNVPGALVNPLQVFAKRNINLSRIESRPTKRSLGEYLFFLDLEGSLQENSVQDALQELEQYTETIKIFGSYDLLT
ncbi:MAG: prephenate dehydratase [Microcystaceae cyanobacterium]